MNAREEMWLNKTIDRGYSNLAGIIISKDGNTVYENYFHGCSAFSTVHVASVTKSVVSALFGIAIDEGDIKDVNQKVLDFFPDYTIARGEKTIQDITLKHMLTMTAPYKCKTEPYKEFFTSDHWINTALDLLGGKGTIGEFRYSPIVGSHILSGIFAHATGQNLHDYASEKLFSPLGIQVEKKLVLETEEENLAFLKANNMSGWVVDPQGLNTAGWGLTLTTKDMAKIGQLYLDYGRWNGKQIVPSSWVAESTREHSSCNENGKLSYGYLWRIFDEKNRIYAALGDGGNVIYVNEGKRMVVAISSIFMPQAKDRIQLIQDYIEPMF